ncbi:MAG: hypothetical protein HUK40_10335 [Desulfobacter sp.]|nr:hypothetical protein [Desulfobacter sp.]
MRPSNPFDLTTLTDLVQAFKESRAQKDICMIYRAQGKNFTFGANLKYTNTLITEPGLESEANRFLWAWQDVTSAMTEHPGVIIVGYHGWVVGGGGRTYSGK